MTQTDDNIKKAVTALKNMDVPTANRVDLSQVATNDKGRVLTQTELIETELDTLLADYKVHHKDLDVCFNDAVATTYVRKHLAALALQHRHDVYFQAYRDGLVQGRKEATAIIESAKEAEGSDV